MLTITIKTKGENKPISFNASNSDKSPVPFVSIMSTIFNTIHGIASSACAEHPEYKEGVYDMINEMCSEVLARFAPEIEKHPDLTVEAIEAMEDYIIEKKISELPPEERAAAVKAATEFLKMKTEELRKINTEQPDVQEATAKVLNFALKEE